MSQFESTWDALLGFMKTVQHSRKLNITDNGLIHSARSRAGPKMREFEKQEIERILVVDGTEPGQM